MIRIGYLMAPAALAIGGRGAFAQINPLDAEARKSAIDGILRTVRDSYVFPDVGAKMEKAVRGRFARGEYDSLTDGQKLADALTRDLRDVSHDLHLRIHFSARPLPPARSPSFATSVEEMETMRRHLGKENFGLGKVEILNGNVGYVRFDYFAPPEIAGDTYAAALNTVANTEALILDLRRNGGSMSEDAIPMVCGYFFERSVHLNDFYWRSGDRTRQTWSFAHVPGRKYLNKPIYVLTSGRTFSGAEEIAYDLKNLKRATLVGEVTGGGANGGGDVRIDDHFSIFVPNGRAVNPITKTNWEGIGVAPDVKVPAVRALEQAYGLALDHVLATAAEPEWKAVVQSAVADVKRARTRYKKVMLTLKGSPDAKEVFVAGEFNHWSPRANRMTRKGNVWVCDVEMEAGRQPYKFIVDGAWIVDSANPNTARDGEHTNSVVDVE